MTSEASRNCKKLRDAFEGREAIYIEKSFYRVRVTNIRSNVKRRWIKADIQEIPTVGFPPSFLHWIRPDEPGPSQWDIGGGFETCFSKHTWHMGYGGFSLFFAPKIVTGVMRLASGFPAELDPLARYNQVIRFLEDRNAYERTIRVFPDRKGSTG